VKNHGEGQKNDMKRKPMRVYADTSVFGGTCDMIFEESSNAFFEQVREGRFQLVVSGLVEKELRKAPEPVRALFEEFLPDMEVLGESEPALLLQTAYLDTGIVTPNWADDALHVALASVSECSVIVSWNFRHIVNLKRISLYNGVNMMHGYRAIEIRTPLEILDDEEKSRQ
jgi:hypothetical protein